MKLSDYIRDLSVFRTRYVDDGFVPYTDFGRHGCNKHLDKDKVTECIKKFELGSLYYPPYDGPHWMAGEWGYTFLNLNGLYDGSGLKIESCGWIDNPPKSRKDALERMENWMFAQYAKAPYNMKRGEPGMGSMNGHCHFQHYAAEWGCDYIGAEIGENIASSQIHMAFVRGAARQYGKVGIMYFSNWYEGKIGTKEEFNTWDDFGRTDGGHSLNLLKRSYIMSYMGGAASFTFEAGINLAFIGPNHLTEDGSYQLTPYGETMRELVAFSQKNPDIGVTYTPIGIVLDYYHGITNHSNLSISKKCHDRAFGYFPNTPGDDMTWELFRLWYPESGLFGGEVYSQYGTPDEEKYQVNTPYGDTYDILLQNASQKVLSSYPCLLLCGDIQLSDEEARRYEEYVRQGGTLILNTAYLKYFPVYQQRITGDMRQDLQDEAGTVIVYGPDYSLEQLDGILREQLAKWIPFSVSGDVQELINIKDGSIIVTLINNKGVRKPFYEPEQLDETQSVQLQLAYTGEASVSEVRELCSGESVMASGGTVDVTLGPGEYKVFEFLFG